MVHIGPLITILDFLGIPNPCRLCLLMKVLFPSIPSQAGTTGCRLPLPPPLGWWGFVHPLDLVEALLALGACVLPVCPLLNARKAVVVMAAVQLGKLQPLRDVEADAAVLGLLRLSLNRLLLFLDHLNRHQNSISFWIRLNALSATTPS